MQDIVELERRIVAALARIERGIDALPASVLPVKVAAGEEETGPDRAPGQSPIAEGQDEAVAGQAEAAPVATEPAGHHPGAEGEAERSTVLRLRQRLAEARDQEAALRARYEGRIAELSALLETQGRAMQQLRDSTGTMAEELGQLRAEAESGLAPEAREAGVVRALRAEVEALRALRASERVELDEMLAALDEHLTEAENA